MLRRLLALNILLIASVSAAATPEPLKPEPARIAELVEDLGHAPLQIAPAIDDRQAWETLAKAFGKATFLKRARQLASQPIPVASRELYLDFKRTGNRDRYQKPYFEKRRRLYCLVVAECIANRGEFLPQIEAALASICDEPTWCLPAHDKNLDNLEGRQRTVDLFIAETSFDLAVATQWLGDRLQPATRQRIRDQLEQQTFQPYEQSLRTGSPKLWWLQGTNNWNAVCLAGVTGAALTTIEEPERRALYVAAAEKYIANFLAGFTPDGYCTEGISYWNYGVGHYLDLTETVRNATDGEIDWYARPRTRVIASSAWKLPLAPGVYPCFADASLGSQANPIYTTLLSHRLRIPLLTKASLAELVKREHRPHLYELGLILYPLAFSQEDALPANQLSLRDSFKDAAVYVFRLAPTRSGDLALAVKGGNNAEHHNHNDVGTYVVAAAGQTPLLDPGKEVYTSRTFSSHRYESNLLNSFGHPVPRVAGQLQRTGKAAAAKVVGHRTSDRGDELVLDLSSAYDVESLQSLTRHFDFQRNEQGGRIIVADVVKFSSPQAFETALLTNSKWQALGEGKLRVGEGAAAVEIAYASDSGELVFEHVKIDEDAGRNPQPTRLSFRVSQPVEHASITLTITRSKAEQNDK